MTILALAPFPQSQGPDQLQELVMKMMMTLSASVDGDDYDYDCLVFMAIMKIMLVWYQQQW